MDILNLITQNKRREIESFKRIFPLEKMRSLALNSAHRPCSLRKSIATKDVGVIAEFKRRSPSRGEIHGNADVATIVTDYELNGASACSILTDTRFFGGSINDLIVARNVVTLPLLRKDFIIDEYQIYEARACGADAILLIAAILTPDEICRFITLAHSLGLETLLELHNECEFDKYNDNTDLIGINNRDLSSFHTDIDLSAKLATHLPDKAVKVAESGIKSGYDIKRLSQCGFNGFLIGEALMKELSPGSTLKRLINETEN